MSAPAIHRTVLDFRAACDAARAAGARLGFVPTLGALHAGHLHLVRVARRHADRVAVSIFVNPTQFGPNEDFSRYPRNLERDVELLAGAGADLVLAPSADEVYPKGEKTRVRVSGLSEHLCGPFRPGHFEGVATVVAKLFNIVRPHAAVFGKKDFQQLHILRALNRQLNFGIEIVGGDTVRERDGLAMSSRNSYLAADEREEAVRLSRNLKHVKREIEGGSRDFARLAEAAAADLASHGWKVDYVELRNRATLAPPGPDDRALVVLAAAWLGKTRLIDNLEIDSP